MIIIESIEIEEFRGARKLILPLGKKSYSICGPNGTGKSGIVDAIEFALTGNITRLSGAGTADLSVKSHAPHVDSSKNPERSRVKITAFSPTLKQSLTIERKVSSANVADVQPNNTKTQAIAAQLAMHPEFALSRREIVKYIITPAGQRSKDVQTLLRLDQIEKTRQSFQKIANDTKKESQRAAAESKQAREVLIKHLEIPTLTKANVLKAVNESRSVLKLPAITDLTQSASLKDGVAIKEDKQKPTHRLKKASGLSDVEVFNENVAEVQSEEFSNARTIAALMLDDLKQKPALLRMLRRQVLLKQGLDLLDDNSCPLCDNEWDITELQNHLAHKIEMAGQAAILLKSIEEALEPIIEAYCDIEEASKQLSSMCEKALPKLENNAITGYLDTYRTHRETIENVCESPDLLDATIDILSAKDWKIAKPISDQISKLADYLKSLPDPSKEDQAKEYLIMAQDRMDQYQLAKKREDISAAQTDLAVKVALTYGATSTAVLEGIYDSVENDFTDYYRIINQDDEEKFEGELTPSPAKLAFDVDFYGRGKFPPGAYHSEGHQDGMGLCLYLALMNHTLGKDFTFAVLDDVLMSVDSGHRREVCKLLKTKFPNTQFILTTHDPVWQQFMRTENLTQSHISFSGWTVDSGPQVWENEDVWKQIAEKLIKNDIPGAATTLRRYLEYICTLLADDIRATVEYHGNGLYDLGDLFNPVIKAWKAALTHGVESAKSWGQSTKEVEELLEKVKAQFVATNADQWMINKAVHYNAWYKLDKKEFEKLVEAYKGLLQSMQCQAPACAEFLHISPRKGHTTEALRCSCGKVNINLTKKAGTSAQ